MILKQNKYTKWYRELVERAKIRLTSKDEYYENHHIIPRSLGGSDSSINLVMLTAKEHFIAHLLLTKATDHWQMKCAIHRMIHSSSSRNYKTHNSKSYEMVRKMHSLVVSAYSRNTVTCEDSETGLWQRVPRDEFRNNPVRYRTANRGITRSRVAIQKQEETKFPFVVTINGVKYDTITKVSNDYSDLLNIRKLVLLYLDQFEISDSLKYYKNSKFNRYFPYSEKPKDKTFLEFVKGKFKFELKPEWSVSQVSSLLNKTCLVNQDAMEKSRQQRTKNEYSTPKGKFTSTKDLQTAYPFMTADLIRSIKTNNQVYKIHLRTVSFLTKDHIGMTWSGLGFDIKSKDK